MIDLTGRADCVDRARRRQARAKAERTYRRAERRQRNDQPVELPFRRDQDG